MVWNNLLKGNADKCHFLVRPSQEVSLNVNNFKIKNSKCEKLLDVKFDSKLRFDQYITDLCRRASRRIHASARVTPFMILSKRRLLMNSFFKTQFNYCRLIWMCHSRESNRKINRLHERCLRTIYNDKKSSFKGRVRYIFTSLFFTFKRERLWNKEECLFHLESSFRSWDNQF